MASSTIASAARLGVASRASAPRSRRARLTSTRPAHRSAPRNDNLVPRASEAIQDTETTAADEALPETRLGDDEIPACVGTASKEEFMRWMTVNQALPAQKLELVVDLPEGRGLVATDEVRRGESLLDIPETTLITVERAIAESKLGPAHANLQEWSVLAAFLAEQALAIDAGEDFLRPDVELRDDLCNLIRLSDIVEHHPV